MSDGDDTSDPPADDNASAARDELEALTGDDPSLRSLVADFLDVVDASDASDDPDLSSILEMLRGSVDADDLDVEQLRQLLDDD